MSHPWKLWKTGLGCGIASLTLAAADTALADSGALDDALNRGRPGATSAGDTSRSASDAASKVDDEAVAERRRAEKKARKKAAKAEKKAQNKARAQQQRGENEGRAQQRRAQNEGRAQQQQAENEGRAQQRQAENEAREQQRQAENEARAQQRRVRQRESGGPSYRVDGKHRESVDGAVGRKRPTGVSEGTPSDPAHGNRRRSRR